MLPKDSLDIEVQIAVSMFEFLLEDVFMHNSSSINEFWRIDKAYHACRMSLVEALEGSCLIMMHDPHLLEAFCAIPREGYSLWTAFDYDIDMWLFIDVTDAEIIRRRLGGGIGSDSGECFIHLPHFYEAAFHMLGGDCHDLEPVTCDSDEEPCRTHVKHTPVRMSAYAPDYLPLSEILS